MKLEAIKVKHVLLLGYTGWVGLGFYRGIHSYKFQKEKYKETILFTDQICNGCLGSLFYGVPFLFPIFIHKEIYRLEVNVRKLEKEKKSSYYNFLF